MTESEHVPDAGYGDEKTLDHLLEGITALSLNVAVLRREVAARPTRWEVAHRRRVSFVIVFLLLGFVLSLSDLNTSYCGPGERAVKSLAVLTNGEHDVAKIAAAGRVPKACDALVPYHSHSGSPGWPTVYSWLGIAVYSLGMAAGVAWACGPRRVKKKNLHNRRKGDITGDDDDDPLMD